VLADRDLWVFEDPTWLVTFSPSAVVSDLPLHHERIVSAVASSKPGGSFVVVGSQAIAVQRQAHSPFKLAFNFHPDITVYDATTRGTLLHMIRDHHDEIKCVRRFRYSWRSDRLV
jgi:hypothetical protein